MQNEVIQTESTVGKLSATVRDGRRKGAARKLRSSGMIPAVLYGGSADTIALAVDPIQLQKALDPGKRRNTLIELTIESGGQSEQVSVMLKDIAVDTLKGSLLHADFVRVHKDQAVLVHVPLELEGKPEGVKEGGKLHQVHRTLPVRCRPELIPTAITADVGSLALNQALQVKDLRALEGITVTLPDNLTLALVLAPKKVTEMEGAVEGAAPAAAPEAEGAAKEEPKAKG